MQHLCRQISDDLHAVGCFSGSDGFTFEAQLEHGHRYLHGTADPGRNGFHFLLPGAQLFCGGAPLISQHPAGKAADRIRVHITHHAQYHIFRAVESTVTLGKDLRRNAGNGCLRAQNRPPDGMVGIHCLHQLLKNTAVRGISGHGDFLPDDSLLPFDAFFREVRSGYKPQQQFQAFFKIFRAGEVIGCHVIAGKGIDGRAQCRERTGNLPFRHIKQLMLQIVRHTHRLPVLLSIQRILCVQGTEVRYKIGDLSLKTRSGNHGHRQAVGKGLPKGTFLQPGIGALVHRLTPFRKNTLCSFSFLATSATCSGVTASTAPI